jgi:hypothetical protein
VEERKWLIMEGSKSRVVRKESRLEWKRKKFLSMRKYESNKKM